MTAQQAKEWAELFAAAPVVIDGGLSTQLERQGEDISGSLWTGRALLENPASVEAAHRAYAQAGADVLITASYQVSRPGFRQAGLTDADADRALRAATMAARAGASEAPRRVRVAASVGPYGAILHDGSEYRGNYGVAHRDLVAFHRERLDVLVDSGPDLLAVETIPDVDEAAAVAEALHGVPIPAWMAFSAKDGATTCAGQSIEEAVAAAESAACVVAVGVNCTDPRHIEELVTRMRAVTALPIVVYPNAGGTWDASTGLWQEPLAHGFAPEAVTAWVAAGADGIGGCCGTDASAITQLAENLRGTAP
mgnify:CR=1 FL=1